MLEVDFLDKEIRAVFEAYPRLARSKLLLLRKLIFDTIKKTLE